MNRTLKRILCMLACMAMLLGTLPMSLGVMAAEKTPVKISDTDVTAFALADVYESVEGTIFYCTDYAGTDPYFDGVRPGSALTFHIDVEKAGTYQFCFVTGWAALSGDFTLILDGTEVAHLVNQVNGVGWRTWLDTTHGTVELPAGVHELVIQFNSAGPNVYGMKFAPEGVDMTDKGGTVKICGDPETAAVQIISDYAVQFNMTVPFDSITLRCPSWSNNLGSMRFDLYKWNESYTKTIAGTPVATKEFINYADNGNLTLSNTSSFAAGEYVLLVTNISEDPGEKVGVWATDAIEAVRNYTAGVENAHAASGSIHYTGATSTPLGAISANLQEIPSYEEITESQKDLSAYNLPASSRYPTAEVMPDTWVFVDGLGRVSLTNAEVGDPREDKTVAMFYWNWHATFANTREPFNVQQFIDKQTAAGIPLSDYLYDYDYAGWGTKNGQAIQYFWDEPIYGYYRSDDAWVIRKQAELLTAAGVDVIFSDNTNATLTWSDAYPTIYKTFYEAQKDGVDTPKISNYLPFGAGNDTAVQLREYYTSIYHDGNYRSLWFYLDGKPMVAAHASSLGTSALDKQISEFFTFRGGQPDYFNKKISYGQWGWLSTYPQAQYYASADSRKEGIIEQMTVGVAMNADYTQNALAAMSGHTIMGRSYTKDYKDRYEKEGAEASKWGYNFAEQWNYVLKKDPKLVFVTGWNEWNASRYSSWPDNPATAVTNAFPDQFNNEYSRDIEPSRGDLADHYYYQLTNFVRQYKGARAIPTPSQNATIDMSAGIDQWATVEPYYAANIGNTDDRDADGYKGTHYADFSGRNDIIGAQVARDGENLWFLVECAENITPYTDSLWMNLYIDVTGDGALDGWNSFDFVVNKTAPSATTAVLEKFTGDGYKSEKVADVAYTVNGRYMTVCIPKSALGLAGNDYTVNFAWTDNVHDVADTGTQNGEDYIYTTFSGDILDFYTSGDVAPGGRFKFSFVSTAENSGEGNTEVDTPAESETAPGSETIPESETAPESETISESEPDATTPANTTPETEAPDEGGCSSVLGVSALTGLTVLIAAGLAVRKNKSREPLKIPHLLQ